ncbi:MAG: hypothetical protein OXK17_01450 [Thaumarchaeota archaeon]|nr:hypothetical protein [Nitrososphaerota archaeon]
MEALITRTYRVYYGAFKRAQKSRMARSLDAEFERFDMPRIAGQFKMSPTPSNIVLGTDDAIIRLSELARYEEILARAREQSGPLRMLEARMGHVNEEMLRLFTSTKIVYRGMGMSEFCTMSKMGGAVGLHRRRKYAAINNFVSCSIDAEEASLFAIGKKERGLVVEMDVSRMKSSDYAPVTYEARRDIRVTRRGRYAYSPYEMFGGSHSGVFMREYEIHLRNGSRPIIRGVVVPSARPAAFHRRLHAAATALEASQGGRKIRIKYIGVQQ